MSLPGLIFIPLAALIAASATFAVARYRRSKRFAYRRAVVTALSESLSSVLSQEDVVQIIFDCLRNSFGSQKLVVLWQPEGSDHLVPLAQKGAQGFQAILEEKNILCRLLIREKQAVTVAALQKERSRDSSYQAKKDNQAAVEAMRWLNAEMAIPLLLHNELKGLILLGKKSESSNYTKRDRQMANSLMPIMAVALQNAYLYQQAIEMGNRLRDEMEHTTQELRQANQQLRGFDKAKSEFLSIASHQLYTPLTALRGYVSMLKEGEYGRVTKKQRDILDMVDQSARRLLKFTESLLDISLIESGRFELKLESINLVDIARELVQDLMPLARSKHLSLEFHEPHTSITAVVIDKERIRQVMLNFIDNAIKYTEKGRVDVTVYQKDGQIMFAVADTGKGLHQQDIARLFNKFTRVGGAARFHTEGRGLGLYVARQIVKEHKGEVSVDSPGEGLGSTFGMSLPMEGSENALKVGEKATVEIKAAEAQGEKMKAPA